MNKGEQQNQALHRLSKAFDFAGFILKQINTAIYDLKNLKFHEEQIEKYIEAIQFEIEQAKKAMENEHE